MRFIRRPWIVLVLIGLYLSGCARANERRLVPPEATARIDPDSAVLKAHLLDGSLLVFEEWRIEESPGNVVGRAVRYDLDRTPSPLRSHSVSIDSVAVFETNVSSTSSSVVAMAVLTGASLAGTVACLANPKACFGSCPTFYVSDGTSSVLMAEGFSASIAPCLEAWDLDALYRARPADRRVELVMTNEALETHVVRHADLIAVPRGSGERVFVTPDRSFHRAEALVSPVLALGAEGDCRDLLGAIDGDERFSLADSIDLATRETIELMFEAPGGRSLGLVLATRQSLMSTYLLYQALAYMGTSAGDWFARLERGDSMTRSGINAVAEKLGRIEAEVLREGIWVAIDGVQEPGPLATDVVLLPIPDGPGGELRVRLTLTTGMHRIDAVMLAVLGGTSEPVRISPVSVRRADQPDKELRDLLLDANALLVTMPGDTCRIAYELPGPPEAYELFLDSRGYYWEWIRDEWLVEENPVALARLLLTPDQALRDLAPAFKAVEPTMEANFWSSRYARP